MQTNFIACTTPLRNVSLALLVANVMGLLLLLHAWHHIIRQVGMGHVAFVLRVIPAKDFRIKNHVDRAIFSLRQVQLHAVHAQKVKEQSALQTDVMILLVRLACHVLPDTSVMEHHHRSHVVQTINIRHQE